MTQETSGREKSILILKPQFRPPSSIENLKSSSRRHSISDFHPIGGLKRSSTKNKSSIDLSVPFNDTAQSVHRSKVLHIQTDKSVESMKCAGMTTARNSIRRSARKQVGGYKHNIQTEDTADIPKFPKKGATRNHIAESTEHVPKLNPSKKFYQVQSKEDLSHFTKKTIPAFNDIKFTNSTLPMPLKSGGYFPEDAKVGIRQVREKPKDSPDVIGYEYSGGICPLKTEHFASKSSERQMYEESLKTARKEHVQNKEIYNYYKSKNNQAYFTLRDSKGL